MMIENLKEKDIDETYNLIKEVTSDLKIYSMRARKYWLSYYTPKSLSRKINEGKWILLIAKIDEKIVGFSDAWVEAGVARSDWSCIKKEFRRMGIGTALFERKEKESINMKCHKIETDSRTTNKAGIAFLRSRGFKKAALLKNHWFKQDYYLWYKFV
jgi:ribosomal protein S18 acetylase RimI-like enzyme